MVLNSACCLYHKLDEFVDHILSGCSVLAEKAYIIKHERLTQYIYCHVSYNSGIEIPRYVI